LSRKGINKQQVFEIAKEITYSDQLPTALKIRARVGTGSIATIHKYLQEWKINCFKKAFLNKELNVVSACDGINELDEKKRSLEQSLSRQVKQNEHYAQELITAEKINIVLKEQIHQLQMNNQELQLELKEVKAIKTTLEQINQEIQTRLGHNNNDTINKQQLLIDELRAELKELNIKSMISIQETSSSAHELLMQEKITSMNLQEKVNTFNKQIIELQKQLQTINNMLAAKQQPLLRQIEWQQKIIQNHVGFEKLRLIEEEELKLKFNAKECYGN